eukprot:Gb_26674 [translate_table: standard]
MPKNRPSVSFRIFPFQNFQYIICPVQIIYCLNTQVIGEESPRQLTTRSHQRPPSPMLEATTPDTPKDQITIHKSITAINAYDTLKTSGSPHTIFTAFLNTNIVNGNLSITDITYRNCRTAPMANAIPQNICLSQKQNTLITARYVVTLCTETFII